MVAKLNSDDVKGLMAIKGVGKKRAENIIRFRSEERTFTSVCVLFMRHALCTFEEGVGYSNVSPLGNTKIEPPRSTRLRLIEYEMKGRK